MRGYGMARWAMAMALAGLAVWCGPLSAAPQDSPAQASSQEATPSSASSRGAYLVEHVAMCGQCHTPRGLDGELDRSRWLEGSPVLIPNPFPERSWAYRAPGIGGLVGYTEEEAVRLLTTGVARDGQPADAPMPPFRMSQEDAQAVVDYLVSLR